MSTEPTGSSGDETAAASPTTDGTAAALDAIMKRLDQLESKIDAAKPVENGSHGGPTAMVPQLHDPEVQAGLGRILDRLDKVEAMVEALGTFGQRIPAIGDAIGTVARMGYTQAKERGIDPIATGQRALDVGLSAASPETFDLLEKLLSKQGTLSSLLDAVDGLEDDEIASVGTALVETYRAPIQMAGPLKALFALGDPDVMRTVGFTLEFARRLGSKLGD
ncbi:MAG: DUF1641 domain-containing protein [Myxococcota bacterium]